MTVSFGRLTPGAAPFITRPFRAGSEFDYGDGARMFRSMSVTEITSAIDRLSPAERAQITAHLRRRFCEDTPERRRELSQMMAEMDEGKKVTLAQLREKDDQLRRNGR